MTGHRAGFVALLGRPNVGKSTLLNRFLGTHLSIVSSTAQTTRNRILGVRHDPDAEVAFVDTPGIHRPRGPLGDRMMQEVREVSEDVDLLVWLIDPRIETDPAHPSSLLPQVVAMGKPVILVLNKIDKVRRASLLPVLQDWGQAHQFRALVPIAARKGNGTDALWAEILSALPIRPPAFPEDTLTDRPERFLVAELVREKLVRLTGQEVPHTTAVAVDHWQEHEDRVVIHVRIVVERNSQKGIVIGKGGQRLKAIGSAARADISRLLGRPVHLETLVRVDPNWSRRADKVARWGHFA